MNTYLNKRSVLVEYLVVAAVLVGTGFTPYKLIGVLAAIAYLIIERNLRKRSSDEIGSNIKNTPKALRENWLYILLVVFVTPLITMRFVTHEKASLLNLRFGLLKPYLQAAWLVPVLFILVYGLTWLLAWKNQTGT